MDQDKDDVKPTPAASKRDEPRRDEDGVIATDEGYAGSPHREDAGDHPYGGPAVERDRLDPRETHKPGGELHQFGGSDPHFGAKPAGHGDRGPDGFPGTVEQGSSEPAADQGSGVPADRPRGAPQPKPSPYLDSD